MKLERVVYLISTPFSERDNERFGLDIFIKHNIEVKVVDITEYSNKEVSDRYVSDLNINFSYLEKLSSFEEIKTYILSTPVNTIFISNIIIETEKDLRVLNLLEETGKKFGTMLAGSLPISSIKMSFFTRLKGLNFKRLQKGIRARIGCLFYGVINYTFVISSGLVSKEIVKKKHPESKVIEAHALDYDLYLAKKGELKIDQKKYVVFLDEFFPFHSDYIRLGEDYSSSASEYYKKLSNFFDYIERSMGLEVIIGAHPRSYYQRLPDYWNGRNVVMGGGC